MNNNPISLNYILVIGRNAELSSQERMNMFRLKSTEEIKVMTYDYVISFFLNNPVTKKIVALKTAHTYNLLSLNDVDPILFAYLKNGELHFDNTTRSELLAKGYNLPAWKDGEMLAFNGKQPLRNLENRR